MPFEKSFPIPADGVVIVPKSPTDLGGPFVTGRAEIEAERNGRGVCCIMELDEEVDWIDEFGK